MQNIRRTKEKESRSEKNKENKGFVLLWTILVSVVLTGVIVSIAYTSLTQHNLYVTLRKSQQSYYTAKTGHDCAVYWQLKNNVFNAIPNTNITCAGNNVSVGKSSRNFSLNYEGHLVEVSVTETPSGFTIESSSLGVGIKKSFSSELIVNDGSSCVENSLCWNADDCGGAPNDCIASKCVCSN